MTSDWVSAASVRREVAPEIFEVIVELEARGWRIRRQGHKFYAYCPCDAAVGVKLRIDGTPRNPSGQARRLRRQAAHCPDNHELDR